MDQVDMYLKALKSTSDNSLIEKHIKEIGSYGPIGDTSLIIELIPFLDKKYPTYIHNAVAGAFSYLQLDAAVPILMDYVLDPDNKDNRGSFIYALYKLNCIEYFFDFIQIIVDGNWESRKMAFFSLEKYAPDIEFNTKTNSISFLKSAKILLENMMNKSKNDVDRIEDIEDAIGLLQSV